MSDIPERLTRIETRQDTMVDDVGEIKRALLGSNGHLGMITRVDRIEQVEKDRKWLRRAMAVPIIGLLIDWAQRTLTRGGH